MRTMILAGVLLSGLGVCPAAGRADIPVPVPPEPKAVPVKIFLDEKAKASRIHVPAHMTEMQYRLRNDPRPPDAGPPLSPPNVPLPGLQPLSNAVPSPGGPSAAGAPAAPRPAEQNTNHLLIAGVALTMGLGCGGVWLLRRPGATSVRGAALLIASGVVLFGSAILWANGAPPPRPPAVGSIDLPVLADGKMTLEVVTEGDSIHVILDKETYAKLQKATK